MPQVDETALSSGIAEGTRRAKDTADAAIGGLAQTADSLHMQETAEKLRETARHLRLDTFNIIVMGRFKNGKSTLLNALLGGTTQPVELDGNKGPMVVDDLPATATLTGVSYAEEPYVNAVGFDGAREKWGFAKYLTESTLGIDEIESQQRFQSVREFEMGYPAVLCKEGVVVYDSPGLDENATRSLITREATKRCDVAIIVYRSDVLMGEAELVDAKMAVADGTKLFTVINLWGSRQPDDRLRGYVWNKYVRDQLGGPTWNNQDLSHREIYFVNANRARDGRYEADNDEVESSGLADFERAITRFLVDDRQRVHLEKFVTMAGNLSKGMDAQVTQRQNAAQGDREKLKAAYAEALPKLAAIRTRPARLAKIFAQYHKEAEATVLNSFARTVARITDELPGHLIAAELPSGKKITRVYQQKKLQHEAAAVVSDFVTARIAQWGEHDVQREIAPLLERLVDEIEDEVAAVARQFDEIRVQLGWAGPDGTGSLIGTTERVVSVVAGLVFGDIVGAATGGAGGLRGAAGSIGGAIGSGIVLGLLGVTSLTILFPVAIVAAVFFGSLAGGAGLDLRIKKLIIEQTKPMLARMPADSERKITQELSAFFERMEEATTDELVSVIEEEERGIAQTVELNQREQDAREVALAELAEIAGAISEHRIGLQRALVLARQNPTISG
jgi:hypothetical protein